MRFALIYTTFEEMKIGQSFQTKQVSKMKSFDFCMRQLKDAVTDVNRKKLIGK